MHAIERSRAALSAEREFLGDGGDPDQRALELFDASLEASVAGGQKPVVLFSGGVDSSLIAARLRHLGHEDAPLVHYQFGPDDPETEVAREMASRLGMPLEIVTSADAGSSVLAAPGATYPVPFGDLSAAPTHALCAAVAAAAPSGAVVLDGTGADGAFGLGAKALSARRARRVPSPMLAAASQAYRVRGWQTVGSVEYRLRVLRRLHEFGTSLAAIAQNSLFDVLYDGDELDVVQSSWVSDVVAPVAPADLVEEIILTDLSITCAGIFAQKTLGPLSAGGLEVAYPFLTAGLGALGMVATSNDPGRATKAWMKNELRSHVPAELVDRPKSGFVEPEMSLFETADFRAALADALVDDSVWGDVVRLPDVLRLLRSGRRLGSLPHGHLNVLWALAFVNRWFASAPG